MCVSVCACVSVCVCVCVCVCLNASVAFYSLFLSAIRSVRGDDDGMERMSADVEAVCVCVCVCVCVLEGAMRQQSDG